MHDDKRHLPPSETSLPRLLKNAVYATGLFGKWHLGGKPAPGRIVTGSASSGDFGAVRSITTRTTWRRLER